mgnify:CR=1 FL=1
MKILFLLCYFLNIFLASNIDFIFSKKEQLKNEIKSIGDSKITLGRSFFPYTDSSIEDFSKINLVKNNKNFKLSPIFAIRYSSSGFPVQQVFYVNVQPVRGSWNQFACGNF